MGGIWKAWRLPVLKEFAQGALGCSGTVTVHGPSCARSLPESEKWGNATLIMNIRL